MRENFKCIADAMRMAHRFDRKMLPMITVMGLIEAVNPFIGIFLTAYVLDKLTAGDGFAQIVVPALIGVGIMFVLSIILGYMSRYREAHFIICYLQWENLTGEKAMTLDYPQLDDPAITQLRAKMDADRSWGSGIANTYWYWGDTVKLFASLICSCFLLAPLFSDRALLLNKYTAIFAAGAAALTAIATVYRLTREKSRQQEYMNTAYGFWRSYFLWSGEFDYRRGKDVRIYRAQPLIKNSFSDPSRVAAEKRGIARVSHASGMGGGLTGLAEAVISGGAYLAAVLIYLSGGMTVGAVVRAASGLSQLTQGVSGLITHLSAFAVDTRRLQSKLEFLALPNQMYRGTIPVEKRSDNDYVIEFRDVSFRYPGSERYALRDFNLKLRVGERLAVVGQNGSGKTTMIKLLCRLYDPTEGEITLNGIDIRKYDQEEYRRIFSVVFQDFELFGFSLGQNVASSMEYDEPRVRAALDKAGFERRLDALTHGLDTALYKSYENDGIEISGGEAQKIALARAIYKDAPFVVLDEPTAALDPIAEYDIYSRFNDIVGEKTAVYISHRLSSCRFCQDIAVFHEGRLVERGSHDQLLAEKDGKYAELWHAQAQYYAENARMETIA